MGSAVSIPPQLTKDDAATVLGPLFDEDSFNEAAKQSRTIIKHILPGGNGSKPRSLRQKAVARQQLASLGFHEAFPQEGTYLCDDCWLGQRMIFKLTVEKDLARGEGFDSDGVFTIQGAVRRKEGHICDVIVEYESSSTHGASAGGKKTEDNTPKDSRRGSKGSDISSTSLSNQDLSGASGDENGDENHATVALELTWDPDWHQGPNGALLAKDEIGNTMVFVRMVSSTSNPSTPALTAMSLQGLAGDDLASEIIATPQEPATDDSGWPIIEGTDTEASFEDGRNDIEQEQGRERERLKGRGGNRSSALNKTSQSSARPRTRIAGVRPSTSARSWRDKMLRWLFWQLDSDRDDLLVLEDVNFLAEVMGGRQAKDGEFLQLCRVLYSQVGAEEEEAAPTRGLNFDAFKLLVASASVDQLLSIQSSLKGGGVNQQEEEDNRTQILSSVAGVNSLAAEELPPWSQVGYARGKVALSPKSPGPPPEPTREEDEKNAMLQLSAFVKSHITESWLPNQKLSTWGHIQCNPIGDAVKELDLTGSHVEGDLALIGPVLSLLKSLEALDLSWNAKLSGEIGYLSGCTQLKRLSISGTVVSADPAGIRALLHALPDEEGTRFVLMAIKPSIGEMVSKACKTHLWNSFTPLSEWDRSRNRIRTDAAGANVKELNLSHAELRIDLDDLAYLLSNLTKLEVLDLSGNGKGLTGDLVHLMGCKKLKSITLTGCLAVQVDVRVLGECRNRVLLHLLVQEWLRSNSHVTIHESRELTSDTHEGRPTQFGTTSRETHVESIRQLLRILLKELLPLNDNSKAKNDSDGFNNAMKRVLLELKPYIKTKKFTEAWNLENDITDFVYYLPESNLSSSSSSSSSSTTASNSTSTNKVDSVGGPSRGIILEKVDDNGGGSSSYASSSFPSSTKSETLKVSSSMPTLLLPRGGAGVGDNGLNSSSHSSSDSRVIGLNLQGVDVVGRLEPEVAPLLRRLNSILSGSERRSSKPNEVIQQTSVHTGSVPRTGDDGSSFLGLQHLDLRFNAGLKGTLSAFSGRTDDGDFSALCTLYLRGCAIADNGEGLKPLANCGSCPMLMEIDVTGLPLTGVIPKSLSRAERPGIILLTEGTELRPEFQTISMSTLHFPFYVLDAEKIRGSSGSSKNPKQWGYLPSFNELIATGEGLYKANEELVPFMLWYFEDACVPDGDDEKKCSLSHGRSIRRDEIAFISHRWLNPTDNYGTTARKAHPDDTKGSKIKFLQEIRYLWIDWCCVPMTNWYDKLMATFSLHVYVKSCGWFIVPVDEDHGSGRYRYGGAEGWNSSGWCRLERLALTVPHRVRLSRHVGGGVGEAGQFVTIGGGGDGIGGASARGGSSSISQSDDSVEDDSAGSAGRTRAFVVYARDLRFEQIDVTARPESYDPRDGTFWDDDKQVDRRNKKVEERLGPKAVKAASMKDSHGVDGSGDYHFEEYVVRDRQDRSCIAGVRKYLMEMYPGTLEYEQAQQVLAKIRVEQQQQRQKK